MFSTYCSLIRKLFLCYKNRNFFVSVNVTHNETEVNARLSCTKMQNNSGLAFFNAVWVFCNINSPLFWQNFLLDSSSRTQNSKFFWFFLLDSSNRSQNSNAVSYLLSLSAFLKNALSFSQASVQIFHQTSFAVSVEPTIPERLMTWRTDREFFQHQFLSAIHGSIQIALRMWAQQTLCLTLVRSTAMLVNGNDFTILFRAAFYKTGLNIVAV